jgi:predicted nucleic acid-binding protein
VILVFDTTALSHFLNEDENIIRVLANKEFDHYVIPAATDAEIRFGFMNGSRQVDNFAKYANIIQSLSLELVYPNQDTSIIYAELATWAKQRGISLSNNDFWIAATTRQLGGKLLTLDGDFKHLPQIALVN